MKKRFLLFLLLLPVLGCVCFLSMDAWGLRCMYGGAAALTFGAQALVFLLTEDGKSRWIRFMPLLFVTVPLYMAWRVLRTEILLAGLVALVYLVMALCVLCAWGAAWGLLGFEVFGGKPKETAQAEEESKEEPGAEEAPAQLPETAAEELPAQVPAAPEEQPAAESMEAPVEEAAEEKTPEDGE